MPFDQLAHQAQQNHETWTVLDGDRRLWPVGCSHHNENGQHRRSGRQDLLEWSRLGYIQIPRHCNWFKEVRFALLKAWEDESFTKHFHNSKLRHITHDTGTLKWYTGHITYGSLEGNFSPHFNLMLQWVVATVSSSVISTNIGRLQKLLWQATVYAQV
jgi:hypothetical protein